MRAITRTAPPPELNEVKKAELTRRYVSDKRDHVWNESFIRGALIRMSHGKCVYCEARLEEKSMYMEVEHFYPKSLYQDRVVDWENLLPSCKHCNASKGDHDPGAEPIIDPSCSDPKEHLELHNYRFLGLDDIGQVSIGVLDLNDHRNVYPRFMVGTAVMQAIDDMRLALIDYEREMKVAPRNRVLRAVRRILLECAASSEYSVVVATIVAESPVFASIRAKLVEGGLWDQELEQNYRQALTAACARLSHISTSGGSSQSPFDGGPP
jgi:uncharacterized protein (TIGR02646 family)